MFLFSTGVLEREADLDCVEAVEWVGLGAAGGGVGIVNWGSRGGSTILVEPFSRESVRAAICVLPHTWWWFSQSLC